MRKLVVAVSVNGAVLRGIREHIEGSFPLKDQRIGILRHTCESIRLGRTAGPASRRPDFPPQPGSFQAGRTGNNNVTHTLIILSNNSVSRTVSTSRVYAGKRLIPELNLPALQSA